MQFIETFLFFCWCSGGECSAKFKMLMDSIKKSNDLSEKYNVVRHESDTVVVGDVMDMN